MYVQNFEERIHAQINPIIKANSPHGVELCRVCASASAVILMSKPAHPDWVTLLSIDCAVTKLIRDSILIILQMCSRLGCSRCIITVQSHRTRATLR